MASTARTNTLGSTRKAPAQPPTAPSRTLDTFANPSPGRDYVIQFVIPEFTCNCPLTGQPDFAHFTIDMVADELCVELKSLKLYFWSYRDVGAFHEAVTNSIVDDIVAATRPCCRSTASAACALDLGNSAAPRRRGAGVRAGPLPTMNRPSTTMDSSLQGTIDRAWEARASLDPLRSPEVRDAVETVITAL